MFTDPRKTSSGLFVVDWADNYPAWRAWREWLHDAFGKRSFPQKMTTMFAWPPETPEGTQAVANWLEGIRKEIESEGKKQGGGPCAAMPDIILPWRGWNPELKTDVAVAEITRRQQWGMAHNQAPRYAARHRMGYRHPAPIDNARARVEAKKLAAE